MLQVCTRKKNADTEVAHLHSITVTDQQKLYMRVKWSAGLHVEINTSIVVFS